MATANKVKVIDYAEASIRIATGLPPVDTACKGGIDGGIGRCRNLIGSCPNHPEGNPPAPRPDVVLLRASLNEKLYREFKAAGVSDEPRSQERREELGRSREERAKRLGRNAVLANDPHFAGAAEAKHSGSPIFGVRHLGGVTVNGVRNELEAAYSLSRATLIVRRNTPAQGGKLYYTLQLVWDRKGVPVTLSQAAQEQLDDFFSSSFGVIVWANEKDPRDGEIKHTVNCGYKGVFPKTLNLHFAEGDWGVKLIPQNS